MGILCFLYRYGLFYDENEDPLDALKAAQHKEVVKPVKAAEKPSESAGSKAGTKPAEVKGKVGAPSQQAAAGAKKTAGPKETQATVGKTVEQNKPREGETFLFIIIVKLIVFSFSRAVRVCNDAVL